MGGVSRVWSILGAWKWLKLWTRHRPGLGPIAPCIGWLLSSNLRYRIVVVFPVNNLSVTFPAAFVPLMFCVFVFSWDDKLRFRRTFVSTHFGAFKLKVLMGMDPLILELSSLEESTFCAKSYLMF